MFKHQRKHGAQLRTSQVVKAVAAKRGEELRSHGELHRFVAELRRGIRDAEFEHFMGFCNISASEFL
ncbi:MAG: hypothetical protein N2V76_09590 [Methanophagales archaeon]|nr:hypothetical protein [Methanophagales archaeon]